MKPWRSLALGLWGTAALGLGACAGEPSPPGQPVAPPAVAVAPVASEARSSTAPAVSAVPSFDDPIHADLPQIRRLEDVKRHAGELAEVHGRYEVAPVPGGKRLQAVTLVLSDGERLIRAYRPVKEELHFDGQPVVVVGHAYLDADQPAHVQQVMAPHVKVKTLSLHPLASPFEPGRERVRTPPTVTKLGELDRHRDRWVQVFATVQAVTPAPGETHFGTATLALADGTRVEIKDAVLSRWSPLVGQPMSTIARVIAAPADLALVGARQVCPGKVERCGMD